MRGALDWLDNRTGYKGLVHEALFENVPGGARWRYVWGSTLVFFFTVQLITGTFLWMAYSPGTQTAWESVYYIQNHMWGGWFLRGLHHFVAQAMTILLVLHLMQVVIDGAYKAPREVNFWSGVILLLLVMALSLTGYLLPWDQAGYWATAVSTNMVAISPGIGQGLQTVVVGGSSYGHHTLTRFFALHAGVIPGGIIAFIVAHIYLFRRHGVHPKEPRRGPDQGFWPEQILRDAVACLAVLLVVIFFILRYHGAPLGAPADPSEQFAAARPEWYFLFLFQLLKYFPGSTEIIGAIILPGLLLLLLIAMPYFGKWKLGHRFNLGFMFALLLGAGLLTWLAVNDDKNDPEFHAAEVAAERDAARAVDLAGHGIPITGALSLLREDSYTQGPRIFARNCASCHRYDGHDGMGNPLPKDSISASDLKGFGSREWIARFFDPEEIVGPKHWGGSALKDGDMVAWVLEHASDDATAGAKDSLHKVQLALSAEAGLNSQVALDKRDGLLIAEGRVMLRDPKSCAECHKFYEAGGTGSPDLTGYASREWLRAFIADPAHERFFGDNNDRMPSFGPEKTLSDKEIGMVSDWLRGEWFVSPVKK
ncbi:MAG: cytochrome b N-terminal domain-containing protein [Phycisphaerae bacterium]|nr:cytochrome b N-terminal domain-containing protein [Gemmatimonadaceae bacterium]